MVQTTRDYSRLTSRMPRWQRTAAWTLQIAVGIIFFNAGISKLIGTEKMIEVFSDINGSGAQQLRQIVGLLEATSAVLLLLPEKAFVGSVLLMVLMGSAIFAHIVLIGGSPIPALVLLGMTAVIAWMRRPSEEAS